MVVCHFPLYNYAPSRHWYGRVCADLLFSEINSICRINGIYTSPHQLHMQRRLIDCNSIATNVWKIIKTYLFIYQDRPFLYLLMTFQTSVNMNCNLFVWRDWSNPEFELNIYCSPLQYNAHKINVAWSNRTTSQNAVSADLAVNCIIR